MLHPSQANLTAERRDIMEPLKITDRYIIIGLIVVLLTSITAFLLIKHHIQEYEKYGYISQIFFPIIGASSFFVGGFISLMFYWGVDEIKFNTITKLLPENERKVMQIMYEKRRLPQADIGMLCSMPSVKTSRAISSLQDRGVLEKQQQGNTNIITSEVYKKNPSFIFPKLPGLDEKRLIIGFGLVFLLGVFISVLNSIHLIELEHPFRLSNYVFSAEFLAIGGLVVTFLRRKISSLQFTQTLHILPEDERKVFELLITRKTLTQMDIVKDAKIHKMKVSRIIKKFEQFQILEKRPYGYTNVLISKV